MTKNNKIDLMTAFKKVQWVLQAEVNENPRDLRLVEYLTDAKDGLEAAVDWSIPLREQNELLLLSPPREVQTDASPACDATPREQGSTM